MVGHILRQKRILKNIIEAKVNIPKGRPKAKQNG